MSWRLLDVDSRDVGACYPRQSPYARAALSTFAGLGKRAWLVAWRGSPAWRRRHGYGLSTSSRIGICAVRKTGRLPRATVSWSRPSKTRGNSCKRLHDVDGPKYDGRSKSAQSALACGLPGVALAMWREAGTLALRRGGVEPSLHKP